MDANEDTHQTPNNTRSLTLTEAGERFLNTVSGSLANIQPRFCSGTLLRPTNARNLREKIEKLSLTVRVSTMSQ